MPIGRRGRSVPAPRSAIPRQARNRRKRWIRGGFALAALCLLLLAPVAGFAQGLKGAMDAALSRPAPAQAPADAVRRLDFARDAQVTAREREAFVGRIAGQPGGEQMAAAIRSGKLMNEFDRLLRRYGYSPQNLGDVLSAYLIICWEIVNEADSNDEPAGQRAVRRQLAGALASVPSIANLSDAQKQAQAERTAYLTMVAGSAYQSLKRGGDRARIADLQRSVRGDLLKSGVDLRTLALTPGGLVKR